MKLFKPIPHPGILLFGGVLGFFAFMAFQMTSIITVAAGRFAVTGLAAVLAATSFYLTMCFIRGLRMELALKHEGTLTFARITKVSEGHGGKGMPAHWLRLSFEFRDTNGEVRRDEFVENYQPGTMKWQVGDSARIRYHPEEPSIYRWLGGDES